MKHARLKFLLNDKPAFVSLSEVAVKKQSKILYCSVSDFNDFIFEYEV